MTNNLMLSGSQRFSPGYDRLRFAIDRFLAGKIRSMHLQSWCFAHFDELGWSVDEREEQFWKLTILNLEVFHCCDLQRSALEQSLAVLLASMDATGIPSVTPLTQSECFYEMQRRGRRNRHFDERQVVIALGGPACR